MGFFARLKNAAVGLMEDVVEGIGNAVDTVVEVTEEVVDGIREVTSDLVDYAGETLRNWGSKLSEVSGFISGSDNHFVTQPVTNYVAEEEDRNKAEEAATVIENHFEGGVKQALRQQPPEQRFETFVNLANDASTAMGLNPPQVQFFEPKDPVENSICGFYSRNDDTLTINAGWIVSDDVDLITEQVFTVFHELEHKRQWEAVERFAENGYSEDLGYSLDKIINFSYNFNHYVTCAENFEAYNKQPVECDAFGFENLIKDILNER